MDYISIFNTIGKLLKFMGLTTLVPMLVAIIYQEAILPYIFLILVYEVLGFLLTIKKPVNARIYSKEATVSIGLSWISISLLGALLYVFSGAIPNYTDAVFELISGITTTGATILPEVESLPKGILFYRNFTVWLGGIGILVFLVALTSSENTNGLNLYRAEAAGPNVQKMTNKLRDTALITFFVYVSLTLIEVVCLLISGLSVFDAVTVSLTTAGTGGFTPTNLNIVSYNNFSAEIIITIFMLIFSINLGVYFFIVTRKFISAFKNEELWTFLGIYIVATLIITFNISPIYGGFFKSLRYSTFEVASTISDTGFANCDYNSWPALSHWLILTLMMIGGCAGSTAGGMKVIRVIALFKSSKHKLHQTINPRKIMNVKIDGKIQDEKYLNGIYFYFYLFFMILIVGTFLVSFDPSLSVQEALFSACSAFNNSGPGLGITGPVGNYASLTIFSKWVLSALMLIGRLEIFPILILFMPSVYRIKRHKKIKQQKIKKSTEFD